jgi:pSer/pThr/pTyr-binding forkhead associated (FHA) protein
MTRLRLNEGGRTRDVELRGDRVLLGRLDHCDVVLTGHGVSREHAELTRAGGTWTVRDLGSSNGTFVNDARVESQRLCAGDVIGIGPEITATLLDDAPRPGVEDSAGGPRLERRTVKRGESPRAAGDEAHAAESEAGETRPPREMRAPRRRARSARAAGPSGPGLAGLVRRVDWRLEPADPGAAAFTLRRSVTTVGRDPGAGLPIDDESVSRMHARLDRSHARLHVTDLKSRNGTHVNDAKVLREELHDGDTVTFGDVSYGVVRTQRVAWERFGVLAAAALGLVAIVLGVGRVSESLSERAAVRDMTGRVQRQALESVRSGIAASRAGNPDIARTHFLYAADLLLLSDLAPPGASLQQPQQFFREIALRLPENEREFDFARALDPATVEASEARIATLTNREYVEHQLSRYAAELGQDPHVPPGFIEQVWGYVSSHERHPAKMRAMLQRARDTQPRIQRILEARHLPEAFCYVAWHESTLNPMAKSPVGAVGLWQIMPATARELGLRVNPANPADDERTHLEKSTAAGADYIAKLLRDQGPEYFMLVLASYNRGPGAVDRAKQRIADPMLPATRKYWYLVEHNLLPEETRNYVPQILAVRLIAEAPERFGFEAWR